MAKPEILALVTAMSTGTVDGPSFERNLQLALRDLASFTEARRKAEVILLEIGQAIVQIPDVLTTPPDAVFYEASQLSLATQQELRAAYGPAWRDLRGSPIAYVLEEESEGFIRLFPIPLRQSEASIFPQWSQLGMDYPLGALLIIASEFGDLPPSMLDWLDLWTALAVLGRSLSEDSPTQDVEMGSFCASLADAMKAALEL